MQREWESRTLLLCDSTSLVLSIARYDALKERRPHLDIERGADDATKVDELRHHAVHCRHGYGEADAR